MCAVMINVRAYVCAHIHVNTIKYIIFIQVLSYMCIFMYIYIYYLITLIIIIISYVLIRTRKLIKNKHNNALPLVPRKLPLTNNHPPLYNSIKT